MKHNAIAAHHIEAIQHRGATAMRRTLSAICIVLSVVFAVAAFGVPVGTGFTYQGQLQRGGTPFNGSCKFRFSLWDAPNGGAVSAPILFTDVNVVNGLFTVELNFGNLTGDALYMQTEVQCTGDAGYTTLDSRQSLTAVPYAQSLRPGAIMTYTDKFGFGLYIDGGGIALHGKVNSDTGAGVMGTAEKFSALGVYGENPGGTGVKGSGGNIGVEGRGATAIYGVSNNINGDGVLGEAAGGLNSAGVLGRNTNGAAVWGRTTGNGPGVLGESGGTGYAGYFRGSVVVEGTLIKSAGSFRIDHPLDPANKFLSHSFVESPEMMNVYNGNVTTDDTGSATVSLPAYFEALNRDFRYQLTVLGQFAQAIVSRKVATNSFEIRTDKPNVEVSWQVTGIRQDAYAQANPIVVEESKPPGQQGLYLYPAGFGAGEEKRLVSPSRGPAAPAAQELPGAGPGDQGRDE